MGLTYCFVYLQLLFFIIKENYYFSFKKEPSNRGDISYLMWLFTAPKAIIKLKETVVKQKYVLSPYRHFYRCLVNKQLLRILLAMQSLQNAFQSPQGRNVEKQSHTDCCKASSMCTKLKKMKEDNLRCNSLDLFDCKLIKWKQTCIHPVLN